MRPSFSESRPASTQPAVPPPTTITSYSTGGFNFTANESGKACEILASGHRTLMPETPHPVEATKDLAREAERGRSPRTPLIALTGVTLFVGMVVAVILTLALLVYFLV